MAQTADTTPLSDETARHATEPGNLPKDSPVLLGTFLSPAGNRALVRSYSGEIRTVAVGDSIEPYRVAAIDGGQVRLILFNQVYTLTIPGRS